MKNIKVGCIPVRQAIKIDNRSLKIKEFIKRNKIGIIIASISTILFSTYVVLIINFINLIKTIH